MAEIRALVAAAGRGMRAGLPYPKTLFPIQGKPILLRIVDILAPYDANLTVVASPEGEIAIRECLDIAGLSMHIVVQTVPCGMGDAVLQFQNSPAFGEADNVLLMWGDIPFIQPKTVAAMIKAHFDHRNVFTFITSFVKSAYTLVSRDVSGCVMEVVETRELGITEPPAGERDIGLFIFRKSIVIEALREDLPGKWGKTTGDHGFLYLVGHLARRGLRVEALPIATELDLISLNSVKDVAVFL